MLAMLTGRVAAIETGSAVIDVSGVGFEVRMPQSDLASMRAESTVTVYTVLSLTQDALTLYGFLSRTSKSLFAQLQKVSGIGPRVALSILSTLNSDQLAQAVADGDAAVLSRAPGLGKKGAQKIILELSGKLDLDAGKGRQGPAQTDDGAHQVVEGLISLGWLQRDAEQAVEQTCKEGDYTLPLQSADIPKVLKQALTRLDRGR
ncbi:Holliday junction branch migration protein RuvA [Bifidobacterium sp. W8109]|uniref:Holliday junction branch migration protein RuvA n=1 Tax=Bifidobacterium TaxID=1678 RepID=UPI0018DD6796|nr:Holliday junction branch migration protein RuvA [Bifidobacterium asteroides]MBH9979562.1 Holliday junction branch migration protein RuvA [Bifidobacterium asteroides]MBI0073578.1 Holliday junction branch migration protein RuvA [Bifidobacterium sp. W8110]MBI0099193.1 Holliday junction branch migration protein RuvA [Bifidobacterium sp. W8114]